MATQNSTDPFASIATPIQAPTGQTATASATSDPFASIATPLPDQQTSAAPDPTFTGPVAQHIGEFAAGGMEGLEQDVIPAVKNLPAGIYHSLTATPLDHLHTALEQTLPLIDSYEKARATGGSITDGLKAANDTAIEHAKNIIPIGKIVDAFKSNPTRASGRALMDAAALATSLLLGGKASEEIDSAIAGRVPPPPVPVAEAVGSPSWLQRMNPFRTATPGTSAESNPGFIRRTIQGENVAQGPAEQAVRTAVKTGGTDVGLSTVQPASLRTIAEEPISSVNGLKKGVYGQVDQAAGTDLKTLYGKLDAINDKIDLEASGSPEEARLEAQRTSQMQTIEDAKQTARSKGVNVDDLLDKGDGLHTKEMALRDFQKNFLKNPNIVGGNIAHGTPEMANVDSGIKVLQKLQDNTKYGAPRLEQALGKQGAKQLLDDMYAAQRLGVKAVDTQKMMARIRNWTGIGAGALGGLDIAKHLME